MHTLDEIITTSLVLQCYYHPSICSNESEKRNEVKAFNFSNHSINTKFTSFIPMILLFGTILKTRDVLRRAVL